MNNKKYLAYAVVFLVLAALVYLQFRTWRNFDWATFLSQTGRVNRVLIARAIGWIYLAYVMRALRWSVFLRRRRRSSTVRLLSPTIVGFTALALLGRAGEMVRPYLISRKENLPFSSQLAVWAVERIFDLGAFAVLLATAILLSPVTRGLLHYYRLGGIRSFALILLGAAFGVLMIWKGDKVVKSLTAGATQQISRLGELAAFRIREFRSGLNAVQDVRSFLEASAVSLIMWIMISFSYRDVLYSYGQAPLLMPLTQIPLLMLSSMVGSMIALPGVGGGAQLATIFTLQRVFGAPRELAASCGILLWLVTFAAIVPVGLILAHRDRLSIRELSSQTQQAENEDVPTPSPQV